MSADVEKGTARVAAAINSVQGGVDFGDCYSNSILVACYTPPRKSEEAHRPAITNLARRLHRDGKVEDNLLKRNEEYKAKLDILRRGRDMEELLQSRTPETTALSKNLQLKEAAHLRLYHDARSRTDNLNKLKESFAPPDPAPRPTPAINTYSKDLNRTTQHLYDWNQRKEDKLQRHREEKAAQEVTENKPIPQVNALSKKIVEGSRECPVEELLLREHEKRVRKQRLLKEQEKDSATGTPQRQCARRRSVSSGALERLIEISTPSVRVADTQATEPPVDPDTGQVLFTPRVNKKFTKHHTTDIWTRLIEEGQRQEFRRQRAKDMTILNEISLLQTAPSLSAHSNMLAEMRRQKEPGIDRLQQSTHHIKSNATMDCVRDQRNNNTFTPHVSENSRRIDKETGRCHSRDGRYLKKEQIRAKHMTAKRDLPPTPDQVRSSKVRTHSPASASDSELFNRQQHWSRQRQHRLRIQRHKKVENEQQSCTFTPRINSYQPSAPDSATEYNPPRRTEKETYATVKGAAWLTEIHQIRKQQQQQQQQQQRRPEADNSGITEYLPVECP